MSVGQVSEIHRYPVKSMLGERLERVPIGLDGLLGDRAWATRDETRAQIEGARRLPQLLNCAARFRESVEVGSPLPTPEIALPDGATLRADAPEIATRLSEALGHKVTIWPRVPADQAEHYRRGAPDNEDMLEELRSIFARLPGEPLPDLGKLPQEVMASATLPGTYFDCFPLMLMSNTALTTLSSAMPESQFDRRRFRPNLVVEAGADKGFPENDWVGRRLRIGEAVLQVAVECPRCVMTTHAQGELPKDPKIMRTLVKENGGNLGVYASIETPGEVREGDSIEILD